MRVKKFEAKSMKEALQMVKQELGPDAVILAARDNRKSFGIGGEASVEITAAVSEGTLQKKQFAESRLAAPQRAQFAAAGARQQRQVIDKMVEKRTRRNEEAQASAVRKPITSTSYIDIQDDVEGSPRRSTAFERAAGRNVDELLQGFDQDLLTPAEFAERQLMMRAKVRNQQGARGSAQDAQAKVRLAAAEAREQIQDETAPSERALTRIRNAAREAWKNNPFGEEAQEERRQSAARVQAAQIPNRVAQGPVASYSRATTAQAVAAAASQRDTGAAARDYSQPPQVQAPQRAGSLELVREYEFERDESFRQVALNPQQSPQSQAAQAPHQSPQEIAKLKGEIQRLEHMLEGFQKVPQTFTTLHPGADYGVGYDYSFMFQKLAEAGISTENAVEILKAAEKEIDPSQAKKRPIIDAWVARWFLNHTKTVQAPFHGRLHLFVGGSGSGKTTSLVKMAAHLVVKEKKKVAILSVDSTKVGSVDQMKIYCQILNVPFAVIRNKQDWEWVFAQLRHVDHILVDYPGMQLRDLDEIHLLKSLLPPEGFAPITHLCVSATSKDGDVDDIARRYKVADPQDLIFTNLDQSVQHGIVYNMQRRTGLPLHSFGIGNRIPEDFEAASKERVLDLIFKLTKLRRETT
jgi:flagellar biosynthesis GTPase FlhF